MSRVHFLNILGGLSLLVVFGIVRMPVEHRLENWLRENHFRAPKIDLTMREQLGQSMYVASVGGFRSVIATWQAIQAFTAFERADWTDVEERYQLITQLQPRVVDHWITAKWHMAYNAYAYYNHLSDIEESDWKKWQLKNVVADGYLERGRQFLADGMRYLPENSELYRDMGDLYNAYDKGNDPCAAVEWYYKGTQKKDAGRSLRALYLSALARCPERSEEGYDAFREAYYDGYRVPTVRAKFEQFEDEKVDAIIAGKSIEAIEASDIESSGGYLRLAAIARYWSTVENNPEMAAGAYRELSQMDGVPEHYLKKLGIELSRIPGKEKEALQLLFRFYEPKHPGMDPEVRRAIVSIEDRLKVPESQRSIPENQRNEPDAVWF